MINTQPGACPEDPFCPPTDFCGSNRDYYLLLVNRYRTNIECRQRMVVSVRHSLKPPISGHTALDIKGPFVREVKHFIAKLALKIVSAKVGEQGG